VRSLRRRAVPSPSIVVAIIALVAAVSGTAFAQAVLPRNSVGPMQIRTNAVTSSEIKDRTIRLRDISRNTRSQLRGQQGPAGPPGPPGSAGAGGSGTVNVRTATFTVGAAPNADGETLATGVAACNAGERAVGGGASVADPANPTIHTSFPSGNATSWTVTIGNDTATARTVTVYAVCVT
jgi:hypothetical protein